LRLFLNLFDQAIKVTGKVKNDVAFNSSAEEIAGIMTEATKAEMIILIFNPESINKLYKYICFFNKIITMQLRSTNLKCFQ